MEWKVLKRIFLVSLPIFLISCASIRPLTTDSEEKASDKRLAELDDQALEKKFDEAPLVLEIEETISKSEVKPVVKKEEKVELKQTLTQTLASRKKAIAEEVLPEAQTAQLKLSYKQKHYDFWMNYFSKREKKRFIRHLKNGAKFEKIVKKILREEGMPEDLFYVGLIESGFNTHIRSHASAVGPWQFIKGTATRYGMRVDRSLDERRNIHKSTRAAAHYFKDLYNIFGSWELALCAYNAGEYRIINAIRKGNTRDYKELVRKKLIPKETIFYIPKVAAAKTLSERKEFQVKSDVDPNFYFKTEAVEFDRSFDLRKVARVAGISYKTMLKLNPDAKKAHVTVGRKDVEVIVPKKSFKKVFAYEEKLVKRKAPRVARRIHRVRKGENLYRVARKYGLSLSQLKRLNGLKRNTIYIGQKLKVSNSSRKVASKKSRAKIYVVKKGDNLYRIARRFGTSIKRIVAYNSLKRRTIYPRQKIYIPTGS